VTIIINSSRRPPAASTSRLEEPAVKNEDQVLVQPLSTYHEGTEHKSALSEPYRAARSHAVELQALGIAKIIEPKKPVETEAPVEAEDESDEEPDTERPDDESDQARAPRRRGRPPGKRS
jgi:hypothetical protein